VNVTISLPDDLVKQARHRAVDQGLSLSRYVAAVLEKELGDRERLRHEAWESMKRRLAKGYNLGTNGQITWTRDELYER
jgi:post-segregation antitoxin (ccd killing protein)